jgi:hypothetical protein
LEEYTYFNNGTNLNHKPNERRKASMRWADAAWMGFMVLVGLSATVAAEEVESKSSVGGLAEVAALAEARHRVQGDPSCPDYPTMALNAGAPMVLAFSLGHCILNARGEVEYVKPGDYLADAVGAYLDEKLPDWVEIPFDGEVKIRKDSIKFEWRW